MTSIELSGLVNHAAQRYRRNGQFSFKFACGKLRHDPMFGALLMLDLFGEKTRILDLGCGQGLFANWLHAACELQDKGQLPAAIPVLQPFVSYRGIELKPADVARAVGALPSRATVECADICDAEFGLANRVLLLDVLHYLDFACQELVLEKVRGALRDGGVLVLRVGDPDAGWRFKTTLFTDHLIMLARGHRPSPLYCRPLAEWMRLLRRCGFTLQQVPMSRGTPFANVLLIAHARSSQSVG